MFLIRWLTSTSVRQAVDLGQQARKILNAQRDQLSPQAIAAITAAIGELRTAAGQGAKPEKLGKLMNQLEETAAKWFKAHPNPAIRENVEMFLTTTAVLLAVFTFFVQHFAIPSGSMQPTLYGIHHENHAGDASFQIPGMAQRLYDRWVKGTTYLHFIAPADGVLQEIGPTTTVLPFVKKRSLRFNDQWYTIWFPPPELARGAGFAPFNQDSEKEPIFPDRRYRQGEDVIKVKSTAGDHLFADRMSFNFRHPKRGEIIIFATAGIEDPRVVPNTYYIKRLVALEGDTVRIGDDRHLVINGQRLDAATPHFENVYGFSGPPKESTYSGHVNGRLHPLLAPLFPDAQTEIRVGQGRYFVMGDNTMNSSDCRTWGYDAAAGAYGFPKKNVIGRSSFVFWPITDRFGWGTR